MLDNHSSSFMILEINFSEKYILYDVDLKCFLKQKPFQILWRRELSVGLSVDCHLSKH